MPCPGTCSRCSFPGQLWHGRGSQTAAPTGWRDITQPPKPLLLDGLNLDQMCQQICRGVVSCPLLRASTGVSPSEQHILPRPPSLPRRCWEQVGFGSPWGRHPSSGSSFEPLTELRIPPYAFEATEEVGALWCRDARQPLCLCPQRIPGRAVAGGDRHSWKHPLPTGAGVGSIHHGHMQDVAGFCHPVLLTV